MAVSQILSYVPKSSPIHALDARVKLGVLLLFSIALFCSHTWYALAVFSLLLLIVLFVSRVSLMNYLRTLTPALAILVFIWICNSIPFEVTRSLNALMYTVRISLVIVASFVVTFTTTSTQLTDALSSVLRPLRGLRVPVDDIALMLSLALRFIPLLFEQLTQIKTAQISRGAQFSSGTLWKRLKTWLVVLVPLFIGFFRHADTVAEAMDARCYGGAEERTSLNASAMSASGWVCLASAVILCALVALFL